MSYIYWSSKRRAFKLHSILSVFSATELGDSVMITMLLSFVARLLVVRLMNPSFVSSLFMCLLDWFLGVKRLDIMKTFGILVVSNCPRVCRWRSRHVFAGMPICEAFAQIEQQPTIYDVVHVKYFDEVWIVDYPYHVSSTHTNAYELLWKFVGS